MKKLVVQWMAVALLGGISGTVLAIPIYQDDFNRSDSDTVGYGWSEVEQSDQDVAISDSRLVLRDTTPNARATQGTFDLSGYTNIMLSYDWSGVGINERDDRVRIQWRQLGSGGWKRLAAHRLDTTTFSTNSVALAASGLDAVQFRFKLAVDDHEERAYIDNVLLSGDVITTVPEPVTLMLFGLGLVGLGAVRGRTAGRYVA